MFRVSNLTGWIAGGTAMTAGVGAWLLFGVAGTAAQAESDWRPSIMPVASPAGAKSGEVQLTVSGRGVLLSWIEHDGSKMTLRYAERTANDWTSPRTVASGDDWSVNAIDAPSVIRLADDTLVASWLRQSGAGMHANDVQLAYSKDDGRSWSPSLAPHPEGSPAERLFASLVAMPTAGFGLVWLEGPLMTPSGMGNATRGRQNHPEGADHAHQPPAGQHGGAAHGGQTAAGAHGPATSGGAMTLRFAFFDGTWKQTAAMPIDLRVCECCSTAAVATSEGILAAYRDRSEDEVRDIYVSRLVGGSWSDPKVVRVDNWRIPACPINGPALSARDRDVALAWYTVKQEQGHAYAAFSRDAGRTFGQPVRLDGSASLGRVDVELLPDGSAVASWIEVADGRSEFRIRRVTADGKRSTAITVAGLTAGRAGGVPRVARRGDEFVFAWTETTNNNQQVRTAVARLPASPAR